MESGVASQPAGDQTLEQTQQQQQQQQQQHHHHQQPQQQQHQQQPRWYFDERDGYISWLRGEFAAANAIIDALFQHLQLIGMPGEYDHVVDTVQRRRFNWSPVLYMQHYYTIADVTMALQQVRMKKHHPLVPLYSPEERSGAVNNHETASQGNRTDKDEESVLANGVACLDVTEEASKSHHPANSRKFVFGIEEIEGEQVNGREGLELHERLVDEETCSELLDCITESRVKKKRAAKRVTTIQFGTIPSVLYEEEDEPDESPDVMVEENVPSFLAPLVDRLVELEAFPGDKRPDSCAISTLGPGDGGALQCYHSFEHPMCMLSLGSDAVLTVERNRGKGDVEVPFNLHLSVSVGSVLLLRGSSLEFIEVSPSDSLRVLIILGKLKAASPVSPPPTANSTSVRSPVTSGTGVFLPANGSAAIHRHLMNGYPQFQ